MIFRLGSVMYHMKALTIVVPTTLENFKKKIPVSRKTGSKILIFCLISSKGANVGAGGRAQRNLFAI